MSLCPACENKRPHKPEDWKHHPYAGHGYQDGQGWSHRDLEPPSSPGEPPKKGPA